jgi:hypothetical protein
VTCPPQWTQLLFAQAVSISALYHAVVPTVTQWAGEQRSALQAGGVLHEVPTLLHSVGARAAE